MLYRQENPKKYTKTDQKDIKQLNNDINYEQLKENQINKWQQNI